MSLVLMELEAELEAEQNISNPELTLWELEMQGFAPDIDVAESTEDVIIPITITPVKAPAPVTPSSPVMPSRPTRPITPTTIVTPTKKGKEEEVVRGSKSSITTEPEQQMRDKLDKLNIPFDFETSLLGGRIGIDMNVPFLLHKEIGLMVSSDESEVNVERLRAKTYGVKIVNCSPMALQQEGFEEQLSLELGFLSKGI